MSRITDSGKLQDQLDQNENNKSYNINIRPNCHSLVVYCQRNEALERLYSISDKILIIHVVSERPSLHSALECSTYIDAEIVEKIKTRDISLDSSVVHFVRPMECDENAKPSEGLLEKEYRRYVIFISSKDPAIRYPPRRIFFLPF